jgi:hypothetical protein
MRSPVNASPIPSRASAHDSGSMWIATPSPWWTLTTDFLPVSRRTRTKICRALDVLALEPPAPSNRGALRGLDAVRSCVWDNIRGPCHTEGTIRGLSKLQITQLHFSTGNKCCKICPRRHHRPDRWDPAHRLFIVSLGCRTRVASGI